MRTLILAAALLATADVTAAEPADASTTQLAALEARIRNLETSSADLLAQLQQARSEIEALRAVPPTAPAASVQTIDSTPDPTSAAANAFNPAISVILDGRYARHSQSPDDYQRPGFPLIGEAGPGAEGLALGESELSFAANVDDKFYAQLTLAAGSDDGEDEIAIEESYIETTSLPNGFSARAGRFFSNIGYLNTHHAHTDPFADRPLAYQAFLGNQYGDDGVQLRWIAPSDSFIELSAEALRGQNFPSGGAAHRGVGTYTVAAHAGGDIGAEQSWLAGIAMLNTDTDGGEDGFSGDNILYVADLTWKWAPNGNAKDGGVTLRGEYLVDKRDGVGVDADDETVFVPWRATRRGGYVEGVWRFDRSWDAGYRYDRLIDDDQSPLATSHDPVRHNLMLTWYRSEFSLLRLQYSRDRPNADDHDNALILQYQATFGAHGAHKF